MPGFNPASIGAPSPVGRGGGGAAVALGSIVYAASLPGDAYIPVTGQTLTFTADQAAKFPFATTPIADGVTSKSKGTTTTNQVNGVAGGFASTDGVFRLIHATGANNTQSQTMRYSENLGDSWTDTNMASQNAASPACFKGVFYTSVSGTIWRSLDAKSWAAISPAVYGGAISVCEDLVLFWLGNSDSYYSKNNSSYQTIPKASLPASAQSYGELRVVKVGSFYYLCGYDYVSSSSTPGVVYRTADFTSFTKIYNTPDGGQITSVAYDGTAIVFVNSISGLMYTKDAFATVSSIGKVGIFGFMSDVKFINGVFIAVGQKPNGTSAIGFSFDGVVWGNQSGRYSDPGYNFRNVVQTPDNAFVCSSEVGCLLFKTGTKSEFTMPILASIPVKGGAQFLPYMRVAA